MSNNNSYYSFYERNALQVCLTNQIELNIMTNFINFQCLIYTVQPIERGNKSKSSTHGGLLLIP